MGSEVTVQLGSPIQVTVPDFAGMTGTEAQDAASAVGLSVDNVGTTVTNDQALADTVADQDPDAGTVVDEGSFVDLTIFTYEPLVPDFTGSTVADAQTTATGIGLGTVTVRTEVPTSDGGLVGTILDQDPASGTSVPVGTDILVDVYIAETP